MGLLSSKNIAKAKAMAEKNKDKIAAGVSKATDTIDKKTGGKHADKLKKVDDAAKKYAASGDTVSASGDPTTGDPTSGDPTSGDPTGAVTDDASAD